MRGSMCSQQSRMWGVMYAYHLPRLMEKPVSELWGTFWLVADASQKGEVVQQECWQVLGPGHVFFTCTSSHLMQNHGFRVTKGGPQLVTIVRRVVGVIFQIRRRLRWGKWNLVNIFIFKAWQLLRWSLTLIPLCWTWHPDQCQKG